MSLIVRQRDYAQPKEPKRKHRLVFPKRDPRESGWWSLMSCAHQSWLDFVAADPTSPNYQGAKEVFLYWYYEFRQEFRVPLPIFRKLVDLANEWFPEKPDCRGPCIWLSINSCALSVTMLCVGRSIPNEIKVMGVLKVLGRGLCFKELYWGSLVSGSTHHRFFHHFVPRFVREQYRLEIRVPTTAEELRACTEPYSRLGLEGAVAS